MEKVTNETYIVYLIHFKQPYQRQQHYIGITNNLPNRIKRHKQGRGAKLLKRVALAGIEWNVYVLEICDTRKEAAKAEKLYKKQKNHKRFCPVCNSR